MPKHKGLPFMRMDTMTGRYFALGRGKPENKVRLLRQRFRDMKFTLQKNAFSGVLSSKVLAMYRSEKKELEEPRAREIEAFIDSIKEE